MRFKKEFNDYRNQIRWGRVQSYRHRIDRFGFFRQLFSPTVIISSGGKETKRTGNGYNQYDLNITSTMIEGKSFRSCWELIERAYNVDREVCGLNLIKSFAEYLLLLLLDIENMSEYIDIVNMSENEVRRNYDMLIKKTHQDLPDFIEMGKYIKAMGINEDIKYYDKYLEKKNSQIGLVNTIMTYLTFISSLLGYKSLSEVFDKFNKSRGVAPLTMDNAIDYFGKYIPNGILLCDKRNKPTIKEQIIEATIDASENIVDSILEDPFYESFSPEDFKSEMEDLIYDILNYNMDSEYEYIADSVGCDKYEVDSFFDIVDDTMSKLLNAWVESL